MVTTVIRLNPYDISLNDTTSLRYAGRWLMTGVIALAVAGIFSILLVVARAPATAEYFPIKDFFHVALVVHVDLSVLIWFLAIAGMLWQWMDLKVLPFFRPAALACFAGGAGLIALSPLFGGVPYMSNYIPVLGNACFYIGLALVMAATAIGVINVLAARCLEKPLPYSSVQGAQRWGVASSAMIMLASLAAFCFSYMQLPPEIVEEQRFEMLFWGGGHILQFAYVQLLVVVWLWLTGVVAPLTDKPARFLWLLYAANMFFAVAALGAYLLYQVHDAGHREWFTQFMRHVNGIPSLLVGLYVAWALWTKGTLKTETRAIASSLVVSILIFTVGGGIGYAIRGVDVTIPAHYHGSIVGVTIAFMGLAYLLLPRFGYAPVAHTRMAFWQPIVYGAGQLMHVTGLAWSGGYGVLRKTPGALEGGFTAAKAAMGLMGLGGLLAIIGGLLFVIVVIRSVRQAKRAA